MRALIVLLLLAGPLSGWAADGDRLERVVVLSRHGVRAAMSSTAELGRYSAEPWPEFAVPPGNLTANGRIAEGVLGTYYRGLYKGLLPAAGCGGLHVHANVLERTRETARALAEALQPGCPARIETVGEGHDDPLFEPVAAGVAAPDYGLALAAVAGRIGNDPVAWAQSHRADVVALQDLLRGGGSGAALTDVPPVLGIGGGTALVRLDGPQARASSLSESLLMAYADGLPLDRLAGGRLTEARLTEVQAAHALDFDLRARTPYLARVAASYLAARLMSTIDGRADGIGGGRNPVVLVVGHDGTIEALGGLLDLHWLLQGYQPDQVPPGGALRFELWRRAGDGREVVRVLFTAQSLAQLRGRLPLGPDDPPYSAPVFIPGCSEAGSDYDCPVERLRVLVESRIEPAFAGR